MRRGYPQNDLGPLESTDVLVLAGGLGTRLASKHPDIPKVLAPVAGRPFLDYLLNWLDGQGAGRVVLALGHLADQVLRHLETKTYDFDLAISIEPEPRGTAGAIACARTALHSRSVVVINGDSLIDVNLSSFAAWAETRNAEAGLVATYLEAADRYGVLKLTPDDRVHSFVEKPKSCQSSWVNSGIYWFGPRILEQIFERECGSLETDLLEGQPQGTIHAFRHQGQFVDIGTPESLMLAAQDLLAPTDGLSDARP